MRACVRARGVCVGGVVGLGGGVKWGLSDDRPVIRPVEAPKRHPSPFLLASRALSVSRDCYHPPPTPTAMPPGGGGPMMGGAGGMPMGMGPPGMPGAGVGMGACVRF